MGINTKKTKRKMHMNMKDKLFFRLACLVLNKPGCSAAIIDVYFTWERQFTCVLRRRMEKVVFCASKAVLCGSSVVFCGLRGNISV